MMKIENTNENINISSTAPTTPNKSISGISLGTSANSLELALPRCLVNQKNSLYQFEDSPILRLTMHELDGDGSGGYEFSLHDDHIINKLLRGTPALSIAIEKNKVFTLKVYDFSFSEDAALERIYKGTLPGNIGLGSLVSELLPYTQLDFDEAEEWCPPTLKLHCHNYFAHAL
ncbi:hypothetical protein ALP26_00486 [Pseudomonas savastanoi pv. glycinea]|uniref:hypothetical protein n=3 Tax=Pseudomonas savastanoi TaxID=29438 RepID=UPI000F3C188F|nr:hypothetical protein [Pseudomonas savastanoi]MCQ3008601.1 hypothetical protein [Pseudomonas savastanoi]RMQ97370.1 hypothetical protein ALP95_02956 [Pseudomonas savastanoi pv. glycinea]RMU76881.1 hypothetical protein ALP26_00486 [Pseudomonas savastanoi pv. glycinea]